MQEKHRSGWAQVSALFPVIVMMIMMIIIIIFITDYFNKEKRQLKHRGYYCPRRP